MANRRLKPAVRKAEILTAALPLASARGYANVTRNDIAAAAGISGPAVQYHFGTMTQLRTDLMRHAVKQECLRVIAQGLAAQDRHAERADAELKRRAVCAMLPKD